MIKVKILKKRGSMKNTKTIMKLFSALANKGQSYICGEKLIFTNEEKGINLTVNLNKVEEKHIKEILDEIDN